MVMDKEIMKELAYKLANYTNMKQEILDIEDEIINSSKTDVNSWIRSKNKIGRSTEDIAIRLAENKNINYRKKWILAIDIVIKSIINEPLKIKLLKYKYLDKAEKVKDKIVITMLATEGLMSDGDRKFFVTVKEQILYKLEQEARKLNITFKADRLKKE